jgi:cell division protein FtsI/penicillin-binding protein 2
LLIESSNIGAVRVGVRGGEPLHEAMLADFRLGEAPMLGLPLPRYQDERTGAWRRVLGRVPGPDRIRDYRNYVSYTGPSLSFGYEMLVYPLVFARAFASVVTGHRYELRLIRAFHEPGGPRVETPRAGPGLRLFDERVARWMRQTMSEVVTDPKGTARRILSDETRGVIGGKTGTAFDHNQNTGERIYWASFVGFAPIDRPRYLAMGVLENRKVRSFYGGEFVAPAVSDLLLYTLNKDLATSAAEARGESRDRAGAGNGHGGAARAPLGLASDSSPASPGDKGGDR